MVAAGADSAEDVNHVNVAGQKFDLGALLGVGGLQEMLRFIASSLVAMQQDNEALRLELETVKEAGVARDEAALAVLATRASEASVADLGAAIEAEKALRVVETRAAVAKQSSAEATILQQHLERLDDEFSDVRRSISKKVDKLAFDDLLSRTATFASCSTVSDMESRLAARIETLGSASTEWSSRQDALQQSYTSRLQEVELQLPSFQLVDAADRERRKLEEAGRTSAAAAGNRHAALTETMEELALEAKARLDEGERLRDLQGQAIQRCAELASWPAPHPPHALPPVSMPTPLIVTQARWCARDQGGRTKHPLRRCGRAQGARPQQEECGRGARQGAAYLYSFTLRSIRAPSRPVP